MAIACPLEVALTASESEVAPACQPPFQMIDYFSFIIPMSMTRRLRTPERTAVELPLCSIRLIVTFTKASERSKTRGNATYKYDEDAVHAAESRAIDRGPPRKVRGKHSEQARNELLWKH